MIVIIDRLVGLIRDVMMHRIYDASYGDSRLDQMMLMDMDGEEEMMITTMIDH
jgi:hypothetical protein